MILYSAGYIATSQIHMDWINRKIDWDGLKKINPNIVGWITIPDASDCSLSYIFYLISDIAIGYIFFYPFHHKAYVNYHPPKGRWLLRALRLRLRSLIFESPPDKSGNPYSYRRVHFASTVQDTKIHNATFTHDVQSTVDICVECFSS